LSKYNEYDIENNYPIRSIREYKVNPYENEDIIELQYSINLKVIILDNENKNAFRESLCLAERFNSQIFS
jgi:hypothetical protein